MHTGVLDSLSIIGRRVGTKTNRTVTSETITVLGSMKRKGGRERKGGNAWARRATATELESSTKHTAAETARSFSTASFIPRSLSINPIRYAGIVELLTWICWNKECICVGPDAFPFRVALRCSRCARLGLASLSRLGRGGNRRPVAMDPVLRPPPPDSSLPVESGRWTPLSSLARPIARLPDSGEVRIHAT